MRKQIERGYHVREGDQWRIIDVGEVTSMVLKQAAEMLKGHWTQRWAALDANLLEVDPTSDRAEQWCLHGAVDAARFHMGCGLEVLENACFVLAKEIKRSCPDIDQADEDLGDWNDQEERTEDEVLDLLARCSA